MNLKADATFLDAGNLILLSGLPKPLICSLENRPVTLEYSVQSYQQKLSFVMVNLHRTILPGTN